VISRLVFIAVAAGLAAAAGAEAAGQARIAGGPLRVTPGTTVAYRVTGLPAGARVTVWLVPTIHRGGNCCGTRPGITGVPATEAGVARPRFRWPRTWQRCGGASGCERVSWRSGQRVDVLVTWNSVRGRTLRVVRIR
jgi:hypothetical protein